MSDPATGKSGPTDGIAAKYTYFAFVGTFRGVDAA
jgi:hypothetical protein